MLVVRLLKHHGLSAICRTALAACVLAVVSCSESECIIPPCAPARALEVTVTSAATGTLLTGVQIVVRGAAHTEFPCPDSRCNVFGNAGTYELDISAPGYQAVHRSVAVTGMNPECGCPTVETQQITVALP